MVQQALQTAYGILAMSAFILLAPGSTATALAQANDRPAVTAEDFRKYGQSEAVLVVDLTKVQAGPVAPSNPPLYNTRLEMTVVDALRGSYDKNAKIMGSHSVRQQNPPQFPEGKKCLVGISTARGMIRVDGIAELNDKELAKAKFVCSIPAGWSMSGDDFVSPWGQLGKDAWRVQEKIQAPAYCLKTGRPALLVGKDVEFKCEKVPPAKDIKFQNPDGDGEYKITLKNTTDKDVTVPALFTDGKQILWNESLVIICQNIAYPIPGAKGVPEMAKPVVLKPGETITTTVNALSLKGPMWPMGGYRIEFRFCLGEKIATQSFYYYSKHHDPLREKAQSKQ